MLDPKILTAITKQVQGQFPELTGSKPKVKVQNQPVAKNMLHAAESPRQVYLVTYRGRVTIASGNSIPRTVRVVVNPDGKILKITTSR